MPGSGILPPVTALLLADSAQFTKAMGEADAEMTKMSESSKGSFLGLSNVAKIGFTAIAVAIGASVKAAMQFQSSMEQLHTQAGVSQSQIAGLSNSVLELAGQVGFSPNSLAQGLYHVESAFQSTGITGAAAMDILKTASEGAKLGNADLVDTVNALDAAIVSGIPGVQNFQQAMGALNAVVGAGDMTMQDLNEALGTGILATVKNYGLTLSDVGAALATFGDNNIRGADAATKLRMAVQALAVPMKGGIDDLEMLGLNSQSLADDMQRGGLITAIQDLHDHITAAGISADQTGQILTAVFGKRAGTGLAVLYDQLDRLKSKYADISQGAQNFASDWDAAQKTTKVAVDKLGASVESAAIKFGTTLLPTVSKVVSGLADVVNWVDHSHNALVALESIGTAAVVPFLIRFASLLAEQVAQGLSRVVSGLGDYVDHLRGLAPAEEAATAETEGFGTALYGAAGPIGLIAGAMVALTQAFRSTSEAAAQGHQYMQAFVGSASQASNPLDVMLSKLAALKAQLKTLPQDPYHGPDPLGIGNLFGKYDAARNVQAQISDLQKAIDNYKASTKAAGDASKIAGQALGVLGGSAKSTGNSFADAQARLQQFSDSMDTMTGQSVSLEEGLIKINQSLADMSDTLQKNSDNLDINTQAGRDDMGAVLASITAIQKQAQAMAKAGDSAQTLSSFLNTQVGALRSTASQAGLTATQIDDLINQYQLTPSDINTYIHLLGLTDAENQIATLKGSLASLGNLANQLPGLFGGVAGAIAQANQATWNGPAGEQPIKGARALGGPIDVTGLYLMHAGEYVLPPNVVSALASGSLPGGVSPLSGSGGVQPLISSASAGGAASGTVNMNVTLQLDGQTLAHQTFQYTWAELLRHNRTTNVADALKFR